MTGEAGAEFSGAKFPGLYVMAFKTTRASFRRLGGINITGSGNIPEPGKKVITGNHETILDSFGIGTVFEEAIWAVAKRELRGVRYLGAGWLLPLLNAELVNRKHAEHELGRELLSILNRDLAVMNYLYGTRRHDEKGTEPKSGVAWLAIKSATKSDTSIVPVGHSFGVWRPRRPVQIVIGKNIIVPAGSAQLPGSERKEHREDLTAELAEAIRNLKTTAVELDGERAGEQGRITLND